MKKIIFVILIALLQINFLGKISIAEEPNKILLLHIIEENWDDLEFMRGKEKNEEGYNTGKVYFTKKEYLNLYFRHLGYKTEVISPIKKNIMMKKTKIKTARKLNLEDGIEKDKKNIKISRAHYISRREIPEESALYISHHINYYGKTYLLEDDEEVKSENYFRIKSISFAYPYSRIPEKISLLLAPDALLMPSKKQIGVNWDNYREIRLVEDMYILSIDNEGNLKIKYDGDEYNLDVGTVLELPIKETDLTEEEVMNFKKKYYEYYTEKYNWFMKVEGYFRGRVLAVKQDKYHFGTRVIIINYGYEEF